MVDLLEFLYAFDGFLWLFDIFLKLHNHVIVNLRLAVLAKSVLGNSIHVCGSWEIFFPNYLPSGLGVLALARNYVLAVNRLVLLVRARAWTAIKVGNLNWIRVIVVSLRIFVHLWIVHALVLAVSIQVRLSRLFLVLLANIKTLTLTMVWAHNINWPSVTRFVPLLAAKGSSPLLTAYSILLVNVFN